jgi:predicted outer membrane repeat protein
VLIDSSLFRLNTVKYSDKAANLAISGAGGALYYTCNDQILKCRLEISGNTLFIKNSAGVKGGAIYWDQLEPVFNGILYKDNTAKYYANNTGCFA